MHDCIRKTFPQLYSGYASNKLDVTAYEMLYSMRNFGKNITSVTCCVSIIIAGIALFIKNVHYCNTISLSTM